MYTFPTDIIIEFSDICAGSKVLEYVDSGVPVSVSVFYPWKICETVLYLRCFGYVPLTSLCNQLVGSSRQMVVMRHNYIVNEFSSAVFFMRYVGQSSLASYSRVRYDSFNKCYYVCSFFRLNVNR